MQKLVNLTPHEVRLVVGDNTVVVPSSGVARVSTVTSSAGEFCGVPLARQVYGAVTGLPEPVEGTLLVVSALVRAALPGRADLASPGDLVRDAAGAVIGCRSLVVS